MKIQKNDITIRNAEQQDCHQLGAYDLVEVPDLDISVSSYNKIADQCKLTLLA